jgi:hypothetical protein
MKKQILALLLTITPIPSIAANPQVCEAVKSIVELCLQLKKMGVNEQTALGMFEGQSSNIQEISKTLCSNVYKLEHTEKFEAEFISKLFYESCMKN